jgi:hypothetical protein
MPSPAHQPRPTARSRWTIVWAVHLGVLLALGTAFAQKPPRESPGPDAGADPHKYAHGLGGKAHTSMFGIQADGYKFVYLLDRSASMGGPESSALGAAKAELLASLDHLEQTHQFQIIVYNEKATTFNPTGDANRVLFATERNKAAAAKFLESVGSFDGTRHDAALSAALRLRPDVLFLLTDGDDPKLGPQELERINRLAGGATIHVVQFGPGPQPEADNFLKQLARQNAGQYAYVTPAKKGGDGKTTQPK